MQGDMPRDSAFTQPLCADEHGFSLHAAVRCGAWTASIRMAGKTTFILANERVQCNSAGQVVLRLKAPGRDGITHIVMSPLGLMQRRAAPVPRPRLHLIRCHGVLAPNANLRALVVPAGPQQEAGESELAAIGSSCAHGRPARINCARLLKRVFEIDLEHCPNCGGELKIIAAILEAPVIERILTHLGLQARAPPRAPAREQM